MNILVIEDDYNTLNGLIDLLHLEGHRVLGTGTAQNALDMLKRNSFALILCDFRLPDTNGLSLCNQIHKQFCNVTLFMFTAYCNMQHREQAKNCGISRLFHKPLDLDELFNALAAIPVASNRSSMLN